MQLRDFLTKALPATGDYFVATTDNNSNFKQTKVQTIPDLVEKIEQATNQHKNTYFAAGSFSKSRTANEAKQKKSFYLDLDCGPGKGFADKKAAVREFVQFAKDAKLPGPSVLIDSGNGVHVYWLLDKPVGPKQWLAVAEALKDACEEHNFQADPAVTSDLARVLRAPDTVNYKDSKNPKPCKIFSGEGKEYAYEELRHAFLRWMKPTTLAAVPSVLDDNGALSGGFNNNFIPFAKHMVPECGVLSEVLETGGAGNVEPFWRSVLLLLAFCEDGHSFIHPMSDKHAGYSHKATEMKFGQQLIKVDEGRKPTICTTLEQYMPDKCAECSHKGCFKSPIALGKPPATDLPFGYSQDDKGVMRMDGDETIRILPYKIEEFSVGYDITGTGLIIGMSAVIAKTPYYIEFAHALLCDLRAISKELSIHGIALNKHQVGEFVHLMTTWTQQMQRARQVRSTTRAWGWFEQGKRQGFAASSNIYWDNGDEETSIVPYKDLSAMYQPKGDLDTWRDVANYVVTQGRNGINIAIASAFASPLIKFTGVSGLTLAIVSEKSGTGKSTGLKVAQSVWGHPIKGINALSDTSNSVVRKLGILNNLPAYWDELRIREDVESFIKMMFQIGQGKEKSRLTQSSNFQDMGTWNLLMTVASNEYLTDHLDQIIHSSDAGRRRVFEITIDDVLSSNELSANMAKFRQLEENFGHAGIEYAKYIAANSVYVSGLVHKYMDYYTKQLNTTNDERFWLAFMAATTAGAHLATKIGLLKFNVQELIKYMSAEFNRLRNDTNGTIQKTHVRAYDFIVEYLNANAANTATVDHLLNRINKTNTVILQPDRKPVAAEVSNDRWIRLDRKAFTTFVYENGGQPTSILKELADTLPSLKYTRASIGRGVVGNVGGRARCIDIFMDDPAITYYFR